MTTHRPDFATVQLSADLIKLYEDWGRLMDRANRPLHLGDLGVVERVLLLVNFQNQTSAARTALLVGDMSVEVGLVVMRALESAFHAVRRGMNGIPDPQAFLHEQQARVIDALKNEPIGYPPVDEEPS